MLYLKAVEKGFEGIYCIWLVFDVNGGVWCDLVGSVGEACAFSGGASQLFPVKVLPNHPIIPSSRRPIAQSPKNTCALSLFSPLAAPCRA